MLIHAARGYDIGLWGDLPYGPTQAVSGMDNLIADMNSFKLAFTVHDGDIKTGSSPCTNDQYSQFLSILNRLQAPAAYTPGATISPVLWCTDFPQCKLHKYLQLAPPGEDLPLVCSPDTTKACQFFIAGSPYLCMFLYTVCYFASCTVQLSVSPLLHQAAGALNHR